MVDSFINDLSESIRSSVGLFADDCVSYRNMNSKRIDDINILTQWQSDCPMKFYVAKCHSMSVTRHLPGKQIPFDFSVGTDSVHQISLNNYQRLIRVGSTYFSNFVKSN